MGAMKNSNNDNKFLRFKFQFQFLSKNQNRNQINYQIHEICQQINTNSKKKLCI